MHNNTQTLNYIKTLGAEPVELLNFKLMMLLEFGGDSFLVGRAMLSNMNALSLEESNNHILQSGEQLSKIWLFRWDNKTVDCKRASGGKSMPSSVGELEGTVTLIFIETWSRSTSTGINEDRYLHQPNKLADSR